MKQPQGPPSPHQEKTSNMRRVHTQAELHKRTKVFAQVSLMTLFFVMAMTFMTPDNRQDVLLFPSIANHLPSPQQGSRKLLQTNSGAIERIHNTPRFNLQGQRVDPVFNIGNPDYLISLIMIAVAPMVFLALTLVFGVVFIVLKTCGKVCCCCCLIIKKCCCCCCKSKELTDEQLQKKIDKIEARNKYRKALYLIVLGGCVVVMICSFTGFGYNAAFQASLLEAFDSVTSVLKDTKNLVQNIDSSLSSLRNATGSNPSAGLVSAIGSIVNAAAQGRAQLLALDYYRLTFMSIGYAVALVACGFGIAAVVLRRGWVAIGMAIFMYLALLLCWLSLVFHVPTSFVLGDLCWALDDGIKSGDVDNTPLGVIVKCVDSAPVKAMLSFVEASLNTTETALAEAEAATNDPDTDETVIALRKDVQALNRARADLQNMLTCNYVKTIFNNIRQAFCVSMLNAVFGMTETQVVICITFTILTMLLLFFRSALTMKKTDDLENELSHRASSRQSQQGDNVQVAGKPVAVAGKPVAQPVQGQPAQGQPAQQQPQKQTMNINSSGVDNPYMQQQQQPVKKVGVGIRDPTAVPSDKNV
eukprot:TRINITY_DN1061_c0_g1_i1.p1 TRINITY_DN1061_c0_g1~~TRINITY_DN1061_c0_g1_i1.p1  ORF type:complete len:586 (+),score=159.75 TRINITY_DN1061_c0_g1_i1:2-1759(+)